MNIIVKLTGTATDGAWQDDYPVASSVPVQPQPGQFGVMQLSQAGLALRQGDSFVAVPLAELMVLLGPQLRAVAATPTRDTSLPAARARVMASLKKV